MNNVYRNNGKFDIFFQIPQIIYSAIIPSIVFIILKNISLSEIPILNLKSVPARECTTYAKRLEKCLKVKFVIFFLISIPILIFFWYFISCFCAVYKNTQLILIEDSLLSFGISFIYPFGLYLLPGLFRMSALKDSKANKNCLYKFSQFLSLI